MHFRNPLRLLSRCATVSVLAAALLCNAHAQDDGGAAAEPAGEVVVLRTRGVAAWRRYVWTLHRPMLSAIIGQLEEARRISGEADFTHLFLLSYAYLAIGDRTQGDAALREAHALQPDFPGLLLLDAFELILDGKKVEAVAQLDRYVNTVAEAPEDLEFGAEFVFLGYLHRGTQKHDLSQYDEAIADLAQAVRLARSGRRHPPPELVSRLALAHQNVDQLDEAEALVRELLEEEPGNAVHYFNMGLLYGTRQQFDEARVWYERAVARRADYGEAHGKLAFIAFKEDRLAATRARLETFARLAGPGADSKTRADIETGFGTYWMAVGRRLAADGHGKRAVPHYRRAMEAFRRALEHEPGCLRALDSLTKLGFMLELPDEEIAPYRERYDAILDKGQPLATGFRRTFC